MMKVVHISTSVNGGAGIATFRLHTSLMKNSQIDSSILQRFHVEADFAQLNNIQTATTSRNIITRIRKKLNIHTEHYNWLKLQKYKPDCEIATIPTTSYRLDKHPLVKNADIIHLHWVGEFLDYPSFFKNIKQPIVWTLHDENPYKGMFHYEIDVQKNKEICGDFDNTLAKNKAKYIHMNKNIHIVTSSAWLKDRSIVSTAMKQYPHTVIPFGLDMKKYEFLDKLKAKANLNFCDKNPYILFIAQGIDIPRKGFDLLTKAMEHISHNDFNLVTVGGKENINDNIRTDINHIHFDKTDDILKLNEIYAACDVCIIPSREDAFNLVMLESITNGTPVISFPVGAMASYITNVTGILANEINEDSLRIAINDFLDKKHIFNRDDIRQYAVENFSEHLMTDQYIDLYEKILAK